MNKEVKDTEALFFNENFYSDLNQLAEFLNDDLEGGLEGLPENETFDCEEADFEPLVVFSPDWILERIDEDRFAEEQFDQVTEWQKITKALLECVEFEKLNSMIPRNYYGGMRRVVTKQELLEAL